MEFLDRVLVEYDRARNQRTRVSIFMVKEVCRSSIIVKSVESMTSFQLKTWSIILSLLKIIIWMNFTILLIGTVHLFSKLPRKKSIIVHLSKSGVNTQIFRLNVIMQDIKIFTMKKKARFYCRFTFQKNPTYVNIPIAIFNRNY